MEELALENNNIKEINEILCLQQLRRLHLANNMICTLKRDVFEQLRNLAFLSVERNSITSLSGLERSLSLVELYMSSNKIPDVSEILYLKVTATCFNTNFYPVMPVSTKLQRV